MTDINESWEPALEPVLQPALIPEPPDAALTGAPHFESARLLRWSLWAATGIVAISGASLYAGWWFQQDPGKTASFAKPDVSAALAELSARIAAIPDAPPADQDNNQQQASSTPAAPGKAAGTEHRNARARQPGPAGGERYGAERQPPHKLTFWAKLGRFFHHPTERRDRNRRYDDMYQKP